MILSLKIKNFLSFKDEVTFSFEATKDKHLEEYHVVEVAPGVRILKLGIVYGANASGKSNLIHAFEFLHEYWFKVTNNKDVSININPFLLDNTSRENPSEFELIFYVEGIKHIYSLKITDKNVVSETLLQYPGIRPAEIFTRELFQNVSVIRFNPKLKISSLEKKEIEVNCLNNMSFFAAYNKVNILLPEIERVSSWMKNQINESVTPDSSLIDEVKRLIIDDASKKSYILNFLNQADFNIENIDIQISNKTNITDLLFEFLNEENSSHKIKEKKKQYFLKTGPKAFFSHKVIDNEGETHLFDLPEQMESQGTLRTMGLSGVINLAIERNAFVCIDEIESSLHPKLIEFVIESFLKQSKTAQLLVTTHYDGLLEEEDLIRSDSIWFTNKRKDGSTELYSLSDFKGLNRISSIQKAYKYGKFGAIPNI